MLFASNFDRLSIPTIDDLARMSKPRVLAAPSLLYKPFLLSTDCDKEEGRVVRGKEIDKVTLGRCAQQLSPMLQREVVEKGVIERLVRIIMAVRKMDKTKEVEEELAGLVSALAELIRGCDEAKTRLGSCVGLDSVSALYESSNRVDEVSLFLFMLEFGVAGGQLFTFDPPFTRTLIEEEVQNEEDGDQDVSCWSPGAYESTPLPANSPSTLCCLMPIYKIPAPIVSLIHAIFFPDMFISSLPACASMSARTSPVSSTPSSRPHSHDFTGNTEFFNLPRPTLLPSLSSAASHSSQLNLDESFVEESSNSSDPLPFDPLSFYICRFYDPLVTLLPFTVLPGLDPDSLPLALRALSSLMDANPLNCRALCDVGIPLYLLLLGGFSPERVQPLYLQLSAELMSYSIKPQELRLLFGLAAGGGDAWRKFVAGEGEAWGTMGKIIEPIAAAGTPPRDMQMQLLHVIGKVVEHDSPSTYFHFDGTKAGIRISLKEKLGAAKGGYTIAGWVRPGAFSDHAASTLLAVGGGTKGFYEVQFCTKRMRKKSGDGGLTAFLRVVIKGGEGGEGIGGGSGWHVMTFQDFEWKEGGSWHYVVVSHNRTGLQVRKKAIDKLFPT